MEQLRIKEENRIIDDYLFNGIVNEYRPMILGIIKSLNKYYGDYRVDFDDLYQESLIALYRALKQFKGETEEHFQRYAHVTIKRHLWRKLFQYQKAYENENISIDKDMFTDSSSIYLTNSKINDNPSKIYNLKELKDSYLCIYQNLSIKQKTIIQLRIKEYSYAEIAKELNVKVKNIDYEIQKIKKIIKSIKD